MVKICLTVGACAVYANKVLLMHHTKLGIWLFPGGHIDPDETPDQAVVREFKEEVGLDFIFSQKSVVEKGSEEIDQLHLPFHANTHWIKDEKIHYCAFYKGTVVDPNFVANKESKDMQWFSLQQINELTDTVESVKKMSSFLLK